MAQGSGVLFTAEGLRMRLRLRHGCRVQGDESGKMFELGLHAYHIPGTLCAVLLQEARR